MEVWLKFATMVILIASNLFMEKFLDVRYKLLFER